jgi:hypothetical protein
MPHNIFIKPITQCTLGELIATLENIPENLPITYYAPRAVAMNSYAGTGGYGDYSHGFVSSFCSYRGYYNDLALCPSTKPVLKNEYLEGLRECVGDEFSGWKGDDFCMTENTVLWLAESGDATSIAITGARLAGDKSAIELQLRLVESEEHDSDAYTDKVAELLRQEIIADALRHRSSWTQTPRDQLKHWVTSRYPTWWIRKDTIIDEILKQVELR